MTDHFINCTFCNLKTSKFWFNHISTNPTDRIFSIFMCSSCGGAFVNPAPSKDFLLNFYKSDQNSMENNLSNQTDKDKLQVILNEEKEFPNSTLDAKKIINNITNITNKKIFLDVGAGYGFFSKEAKKANFDVTALELNDNVRKIFKLLNGFEAVNKNFNEEFVEENKEKFDIVLLSQVLEHIPMEFNPIKNIYNLLKTGGICVIAVPHLGSTFSMLQGKKDMFITPPEHLNFFSKKALTLIFKKFGFKLLKIETVSRINKNKIKSKFKIFSPIINFILNLFIKFSDRINKGIYIQAYFQKYKNDE